MATASESRPRGTEPSTPAPDQVHTPDAPRYGSFHDKGGPLSPRRSSRISGRTRERTPSPSRPDGAATTSPKKRVGRALAPALASPRKRPAPDVVRRADGAVTSESKPMASSVLEAAASAPPSRPRNSLLAPPRKDVLPTPAKTPQQSDDKAPVDLGSVSRTLFGETQSNVRRTKMFKSNANISIEEIGKAVQIDIFTDSNERVPEKDDSNSNPFWQPAGRSFAKTERVSRAKVWIPSEQRSIPVNEASKRSDGQVRVFRGRKIWMETAPTDDLDEDEEEEECIKFKPRRLFAPKPKEEKKLASSDTEEAPTDVEDNASDSEEVPATVELKLAASIPIPATPQPKKGKSSDIIDESAVAAPLSPPETRRVTRSMDKPRSSSARSPTRASSGGRSPAFAGFKISKPTHSAVSKAAKSSRKRPGDHLAPTEAKRAKV